MTAMGFFVFSVVYLLVLNTCDGDSCAKQMISMKMQQKKTNTQLEELGKKMDIVLGIVKEMQNPSVLPPCQAAYQEYLRGDGDPSHTPRCDDEGFYQPVQFYDDAAFCVTTNGTSLGYEVPAMMANPGNDCACALAGRHKECAKDGSYRQHDDGRYRLYDDGRYRQQDDYMDGGHADYFRYLNDHYVAENSLLI